MAAHSHSHSSDLRTATWDSWNTDGVFLGDANAPECSLREWNLAYSIYNWVLSFSYYCTCPMPWFICRNYTSSQH